jgi:F-type H+-transporting ATPase subunit a
MSAAVILGHAGSLVASGAADGEDGFEAPGTGLFQFPPLFSVGGLDVTKPMVLAVFSALVVLVFFYAATSKMSLVPSRLQSLAELGYLFIRDEVARSIIGKRGDRWVPLLVSIFFFVWIMNLLSVIPLAQFPVTSRIAYPAILAFFVWLLFLGLGIKAQGPIGYFKNLMFPPGIPKAVYIILAPLELVSTLLVRPFTLAVRLFANMFAGHVLVAFFSIVAWYFIVEAPGPGIVIGVVGFLMTIIMTGFEMFIQALQAFIFTLLAAVYIQSSIEVHH